MEGSGSGSCTNNYGSGYGRPKNLQIRRIRNTGYYTFLTRHMCVAVGEREGLHQGRILLLRGADPASSAPAQSLHHSPLGQDHQGQFPRAGWQGSGLWPWTRGGIFKLLRSSGIDSKESIPPANIAWRAGMTTLFLLGY
jgi:hypothetical protein